MSGHILHRTAGQIDKGWIGRQMLVTAPDGTHHTGGLSDVHQEPGAGHDGKGRTFLWLGGDSLLVPSDVTVTIDTLGLLGGGAR